MLAKAARASGAVAIAFTAAIVGLFIGPPNQFSLEIIDWADRRLDEYQGNLKRNLETGRYFQGIFRPTSEELASGDGLELEVVEGELPKDLSGIFLRTGPNLWSSPTKGHHVFDGDGMVHSIRIRQGRAVYHNAWMHTPRLNFEQKRGGAFFSRVGEMNGPIGLFKALAFGQRKLKLAGVDSLEVGQANTAIALLPDGRLWGLHEGSRPFEFKVSDRGEIFSVGFDTLGGELDYSMSAHPKIDWKTGEMFFHGYKVDGGNDRSTFLKFGRLDSSGKLKAFFPLNASGASFSHDVLLSENYMVVLDSSIRFTPEKTVKGGSPFTFRNTTRARLAVIPRTATSPADVRWFVTPEALAWVHPLHAWEEDDGQVLVLWAPIGLESNKTGGVLEGCCDIWYIGELRLDLRTGQVASMKLIESAAQHSGEFSRIRDSLYGQGFARYAYTALANTTSGEDFDFIGFTKWNLKEYSVAAELYVPTGWIGGEPVFIPKAKPSGDASDDGYIANFLYSLESDRTDFVLYDARTFSGTPAVRLRMPKRVPVGFHGSWLEEEHLQRHLARHAGVA